ncbi:MAG: hypothetical protein AAFU83_04110, partial [Bacteroidota bacterium]
MQPKTHYKEFFSELYKMVNLVFAELKAPRLTGLARSIVQEFIGEWLDYKTNMQEHEGLTGTAMVRRPLRNCMESSILDYLIDYEMGVGFDRDTVADEDLEQVLAELVKRYTISGREAIDLLKQRVKYDLSMTDPYARVGEMFRSLAEVTRLYGLGELWLVKRHQRMRAEVLIEAVEPAPLRETLKLNIVQEDVLEDPKRLMKVIREYVVQYEKFRPQLRGDNATDGKRDRQRQKSRADGVKKGQAASDEKIAEKQEASTESSSNRANQKPWRSPTAGRKFSCW